MPLKEVGPEVETEKNMFMYMSHHQNTGLKHNINRDNRSFENLA